MNGSKVLFYGTADYFCSHALFHQGLINVFSRFHQGFFKISSSISLRFHQNICMRQPFFNFFYWGQMNGKVEIED